MLTNHKKNAEERRRRRLAVRRAVRQLRNIEHQIMATVAQRYGERSAVLTHFCGQQPRSLSPRSGVSPQLIGAWSKPRSQVKKEALAFKRINEQLATHCVQAYALGLVWAIYTMLVLDRIDATSPRQIGIFGHLRDAAIHAACCIVARLYYEGVYLTRLLVLLAKAEQFLVSDRVDTLFQACCFGLFRLLILIMEQINKNGVEKSSQQNTWGSHDRIPALAQSTIQSDIPLRYELHPDIARWLDVANSMTIERELARSPPVSRRIKQVTGQVGDIDLLELMLVVEDYWFNYRDVRYVRRVRENFEAGKTFWLTLLDLEVFHQRRWDVMIAGKADAAYCFNAVVPIPGSVVVVATFGRPFTGMVECTGDAVMERLALCCFTSNDR